MGNQPQRRYAFKATGHTSGHWYGNGYGDTPKAAVAAMVEAIPTRGFAAESSKVWEAAVCGRSDKLDGTTWKYDRPISPDLVLSLFRSFGVNPR